MEMHIRPPQLEWLSVQTLWQNAGRAGGISRLGWLPMQTLRHDAARLERTQSPALRISEWQSSRTTFRPVLRRLLLGLRSRRILRMSKMRREKNVDANHIAPFAGRHGKYRPTKGFQNYSRTSPSIFRFSASCHACGTSQGAAFAVSKVLLWPDACFSNKKSLFLSH